MAKYEEMVVAEHSEKDLEWALQYARAVRAEHSEKDLEWALKYAHAVRALRLARDQVLAAESAYDSADELVRDLLEEQSVA
jgi:hypothetical protein